MLDQLTDWIESGEGVDIDSLEFRAKEFQRAIKANRLDRETGEMALSILSRAIKEYSGDEAVAYLSESERAIIVGGYSDEKDASVPCALDSSPLGEEQENIRTLSGEEKVKAFGELRSTVGVKVNSN